MRRGFVDSQNPVAKHPLNDGLVGWWYALSQSQGTSFLTELTRFKQGTFVNSPKWAAGQRFGSVSFTGGAYVNLGSNLGAPAVTYSAWINGSSFSNAYNAVVDRNNNAGTYVELYVTSAGKLALYTTPAFYDGTGAYVVPKEEWSHVVLTYDSTAGLTGYVNGQRDGFASPGGALSTISVPISIGNVIPFSGREFSGRINDVRIYPRATSAAEVRTLYVEGRTGNPSLLNYVTSRTYAFAQAAPPAGDQYFDPFSARASQIVSCGVL